MATLRERRKSNRLGLKVIAVTVNRTIAHVAKIETGERPFPARFFKDGTAQKWSAVLGWNVTQLRKALKEQSASGRPDASK